MHRDSVDDRDVTLPSLSPLLEQLSWLTILLFPMLATIQTIAVRVGVVTHRGMQRVVYKAYGRVSGILPLTSVLVVDAITIGLILVKPWQWFVILFAGTVDAMLVLGRYGTG